MERSFSSKLKAKQIGYWMICLDFFVIKRYMKEIINWNNQDAKTKLPIELTVGLPALNSEKIIWLPLESLRRQTQVKFGWELIIMEEDAKSRSIIENFVGKLPNCQRILYLSVDPKLDGCQQEPYQNKYLLIMKWRHMAKIAAPTSKFFVFQDSDDYSPPKRLSIHYQHFTKHPDCLLSTQTKGLFMHLPTGKKVFYNGRIKDQDKPYLLWNHLNKAVRTEDLKQVPFKLANRRIDTHIRNSIQKQRKVNFAKKKYVYSDAEVDPENWKYGFFTDGQNTITTKRTKYYQKPEYVFLSYGQGKQKYKYQNLEKYLPPEVIDFAKAFRPQRK